MLYAACSTLFSHWRRHPAQFAMLVLGLLLATALWSAVQAINAEARRSYDAAAATLGQDQLARLVPPPGAEITMADFADLRRAGYLVSPVITGDLRFDVGRLRILGFDPLTAPREAQAPLQSTSADFLAFLTGDGILLVSETTARAGLPQTLPRQVISDQVPPMAAFTDIATAATLLDQTTISYLLIAPDQPAGLPPLAEATTLRLQPPESATDVGRLTESFHLNLSAFGLLSFAVGLFIVNAAIGLAFEQRRGTIRTLRALGTPLRTVVLALIGEMAVIALVAGAAGIVAGYAIAAGLMPGVAGTLRGLYGASVPGALSFDPFWALSAIGVTLIGAAVATASAVYRAVRMPVLAPAQPRAWAVSTRSVIRLQAAGGCALMLSAAVLVALGDGLLTGFAALAGLLTGSALILPGIVTILLNRVEKVPLPPFLGWLVADTKQQVSGLSMALMALLLALAANVGVSTMVGSFRTTFIGWLDQRLAAELYVTPSNPEEAARLIATLAPGVEAILPIISTETRLVGQPGDLFGVADHATYREAWPLLFGADDAWDSVFRDAGVLVNEQTYRRHDLSIGDPLEVYPGLTLPVVGAYSDYGNPVGQAIISLALFQSTFPEVVPSSYAIRVDPDRAGDIADLIRGDLNLPDTAVRNQSQIKAFSLEVFEQTFVITSALNVLTLGVAGFALLTSMLTLSSMRLPQLAPVWAMGVPRATLAWAELGRTVGLAALTFVLALPVGLALAWMLLAVVNVEAFGWRLPMAVFPADWLWLFVLSLIAAVLAALAPSLSLARMQPARLVQVFSQER